MAIHDGPSPVTASAGGEEVNVKRELGSTGVPYRKLIHFMTEYMVDGKEGAGLDLERAMLAGLIDDVLRVLHHADDLGLVEPSMREGFVEWFRAKFTHVATPTDAGLREALEPLVNEIMENHCDINSPDYNECEITECQWCFEARAALSQGGG